MASLTLRPLTSRWLGFESFFDEMERALGNASASAIGGGFPPYDLYRETNGDYTIELALAGYTKDQIEIRHDKKNSQLVISTVSKPADTAVLNAPGAEDAAQTPERQVIRRGIAAREFARSFVLADDLVVDGAELVNGMLTVRLKKVVNEADKPLLIPVL